MTVRWTEIAAAVTPVAAVPAGAAGTVPFALAVLAATFGPLIYICRLMVVGVLGWKALDKTTPERVADVMDAIAERPTGKGSAHG